MIIRSCPQNRVSGCELKKMPDKLEYASGEKLELSGGVLSVTYENGIKSDVALEDDMVSGYDADTPGIQTLTVSYANSTVSFEVEVQEKKALEVPIWQKANLTLEEAAVYTGIGINRLRTLTNEHESLVIFVGRKRLVKRSKLEEYLDRASVV